MSIKKLHSILLLGLLGLHAFSLVSAQEYTSDEKIPPGSATKEPYFSELEALPEGFASDFPHYSNIVAYSFFAKQYDQEEINEIRRKIMKG